MLRKIMLFVLLVFLFLPLFPALATTDPTGSTTLPNPIGVTDPNVLVGRIINGALGVVGSLALIMFIYGGFMWMLSGGNEQMVDKGKKTLMWAALGLVIIFMAYAIVSFVITHVGG